MGDRDAFGREKDENSLAGLGWQGSEPSTAYTEEPSMRQPGDGPPRRRRQSGGGIAVAIFTLVLVVAALGFVGFLVGDVSKESELSSGEVTATSGADSVPEEPAAEEPPATPPKGVDRGSLLLRGNFGAAMGRLRTAGLGRLHSLRVAPDRIDVQLLTNTGRLRIVQIRPGGELRELNITGTGFSHLDTVPFAAVNSAAPFRMASGAAKRLGRNARSVDYLVFTDFGGERGWSLFFKDGKHFIGDARGRIQRRIS